MERGIAHNGGKERGKKEIRQTLFLNLSRKGNEEYEMRIMRGASEVKMKRHLRNKV